MSGFKYTTILNGIINTNNEIVDITNGNLDDNFGTGRLFEWKEYIKVIPKYWLHGCGVDNFFNAFDWNLFYNNQIYDRAHNELLNLLVTEGAFAFISYIGLLIVYLVQSMFNIRVI